MMNTTEDAVEKLQSKLTRTRLAKNKYRYQVRQLEKEVEELKARCAELEAHLTGTIPETLEENEESVAASTLLSAYWKESGLMPVSYGATRSIAALSGKDNVHESRRRAM